MIDIDRIPPHLYTKDVLKLAGVCATTWSKMQIKGKAPLPAYRGRGGYVYRTREIYRFLGLIDSTASCEENDPIMKGIEKLGRD